MIARIIFLIFLVVSFAGDRIFKDSVAPQMNGIRFGPLEIVGQGQTISNASFLLTKIIDFDNFISLQNLMVGLMIGFAVIILLDFKAFGKWPFKYSWHCAIIDGLFFGVFLSWGYDFIIRGIEIKNFHLILGNGSFDFNTALIMLIILAVYLPVKPSTQKIQQKERMRNGTKS